MRQKAGTQAGHERGKLMTTIDSRRAPRRAAFEFAGLLLALRPPLRAAELPTARPADVGLSAERLARLDAAMQAEVDAGRKAGIVALIARRGRVAHFKAFGMADREANMPMRDDSLFRLYSMTKPITSVALLMLYEEGKFQLSDPLEKYIPAFKGVQVLAGMDGERMRLEPARRPPTIHDVFRHTAGFSYGFDPHADRSRVRAERRRLRHGHVAEAARRREPAEGAAALSARRAVGLQRRARRAGVSRRVFLGHAVRRVLPRAHLRAARHDGCDVRRAEGVVPRYTANYAPRDPANPAALVQVETREGVPPPGAPSAARSRPATRATRTFRSAA